MGQTIIPGFDDVWVSSTNVIKDSTNSGHYDVKQFVIKRITDNKLFFGYKVFDVKGGAGTARLNATSNIGRPSIRVKNKNGQEIGDRYGYDQRLTQLVNASGISTAMVYPFDGYPGVYSVSYYGEDSAWGNLPSNDNISFAGYRLHSGLSYGASFKITETVISQYLNTRPTLVLTSNNQPLTENQRIYTGTNDFTVNITANDVDPDDTLQYQVKLNNVVKKDWTAISRNLPVSYTFKKADYINDSNPFVVSVRDNNGAITTFEAALVKYERPEYLGLVKLGTLRKRNVALPRPTLPWNPGGEPFSGCGYGNIPDFTTDRNISNWNIGDTDTSEANQLYWHKIIEGSKTILICDRVILTSISWNDLNGDNRVFGKTISIDGKQYKLRLLTCGYDRRSDMTGGYPENNEWDRYILNDDSISGLPKPESSDRDHTLNSTDKYSKHNQFWNWFGVLSLGQETYINHKEGRAVRGYGRAPDWSTEADVTVVSHTGWRPVLEVLNQPPVLSLKTPSDNQTLTENNALKIEGTASDTDKDNVVTIKYRINNSTTRAIASGVSDGSSPISFAKTLLFRNKRLYDGTTDITGSDLAENTDHTLTIWAEDDQGGKSTEVTRKFRVVHNRPPVISGQNEDLGVLSVIPSKTYTVTEPEGDAFTITEKINGKIIRTFDGTNKIENTVTIPLDTWLRLSLTSVHTLTIEATDSKGMTSTRTYTFRRSADKIAFVLGKPFDTDIAAKRILVTIDATVPPGADYMVEVCNNGYDTSPTWEDTTNFVKFNRGFIFTNKEKTAEKWGVSLRFTFVKGSATEPVIVRGFGGAFD